MYALINSVRYMGVIENKEAIFYDPGRKKGGQNGKMPGAISQAAASQPDMRISESKICRRKKG